MVVKTRTIEVQGVQFKVQGKGFAPKVKILTPVQGEIVVICSGDERLACDWSPTTG